jgi:hypothetical protein
MDRVSEKLERLGEERTVEYWKNIQTSIEECVSTYPDRALVSNLLPEFPTRLLDFYPPMVVVDDASSFVSHMETCLRHKGIIFFRALKAVGKRAFLVLVSFAPACRIYSANFSAIGHQLITERKKSLLSGKEIEYLDDRYFLPSLLEYIEGGNVSTEYEIECMTEAVRFCSEWIKSVSGLHPYRLPLSTTTENVWRIVSKLSKVGTSGTRDSSTVQTMLLLSGIPAAMYYVDKRPIRECLSFPIELITTSTEESISVLIELLKKLYPDSSPSYESRGFYHIGTERFLTQTRINEGEKTVISVSDYAKYNPCTYTESEGVKIASPLIVMFHLLTSYEALRTRVPEVANSMLYYVGELLKLEKYSPSGIVGKMSAHNTRWVRYGW